MAHVGTAALGCPPGEARQTMWNSKNMWNGHSCPLTLLLPLLSI